MIDRDGIQRPDAPDAHALDFKHKKSKYKITKRTYKHGFIYRFVCFFLRYLAVLILSLMAKIGFGAKGANRKYYRQVKKTGGVIVCNHVHYFDIVFTASFMSPFKKVWVTTLQSNMDIPVAGMFARMLGALPIPCERANMPLFLDGVDDKLKRGHFVAFMPESALWLKYRDLRPFKPSAFRFAAKNNKPVLPITLTFDVRKKIKRDGTEKLKYKLRYTYLPPVFPHPEKSIAENTDLLLRTAHAEMEENIAQKNQENLNKYGI